MTPHEHLYRLAVASIEDHKLTNVDKVDESFVIRTPAGHVRVYGGEIASLDGLWLRWGSRRSRDLYRMALDSYLTSKLPPLGNREPVLELPAARESWWRLLWPFRRRSLPPARLLQP